MECNRSIGRYQSFLIYRDFVYKKTYISASIHIKLLKLYESGVNRNSSETWISEIMKIVFFRDFTDPSLECIQCNKDSQFKIQ